MDKGIEKRAIALFEREIELGQEWAREDGLDKIDMMPHKTRWGELAAKDKVYWRGRAGTIPPFVN